MSLNFDGTYSDIYKKYHNEIIGYYCDGLKPGEICKALHDEHGVDIKYQAINYFYKQNKEYIDDCINRKANERKRELIDSFGVEYLKEQSYIVLSYFDLSKEEIEKLSPDVKLKYFVSLVNAIAKVEGKDQSIINNTHTIKELNDIFGDDLNWE